MRRRSSVTSWLTAALCAIATGPVAAQNVEWPRYGGDPGSRKYAPLDQINQNNVGTLKIIWRRPAVDPQVLKTQPGLRVSNNFRATPLMVNGVLYSPNGVGLVEAFHPGTGTTIWVQAPPAGPQALGGDSTRGLAYWRDGADERITVNDLIDFTPALRAAALDIVKNYVIGPVFTPPSIKRTGPGQTRGTIQLPGSVGGADWQGAAFDPETGMLYVESITGPFVADIIAGNPNQTNLRFTRGTREYPPAPSGLPLLKPPYGRITAIDLNKGEHAWMVPNGDGPRDHPLLKDLNLPPLGHPGRGAPLVTKTLLFVGEGDSIMATPERVPQSMPLSIAPGAGGRKFRAFDKASGKILWETEFPAGTTGAPMSYLFDGKQFIVVAIGSREHPAEFVALGLP